MMSLSPMVCNMKSDMSNKSTESCASQPFKVKKAVLGTFDQGNPKYGTTAGIQCTSNAFIASCFSVVKRVSIWKSFDLDYILDQGDKLMKLLEARGNLCIDQLPLSVDIERFKIRAQKLMLYSDLFNSVDLFFHYKCLSSDEIGNGAIFTCAGTSIALIWNKNSAFVFDCHSRDSKGCHISDGKSVCLEFRSVEAFNSFIIKYFEYAMNTRFLQYDIQYIKVEASHTCILNILTVLRHRRQLDHKRSCKRRNKDYINSPLSKKTICEAKNESQCFFVDDNNGVNRHKEYYQKNKEKMKNSAVNYRNAN